MIKGLEAFERVYKSHRLAMALYNGKRDVETEKALDIIEKELKALEIIKKETSLIELNARLTDDVAYFEGGYLNQEEYDLLKEVLCDE